MVENIYKQLNSYFAGQPVNKAWVFGSFARGEERPDSDVDILVQLDKSAHVSLLGYCRMICQLEELLGRDVDLVEDGQLLPFAVKSANRDKILVYERKSQGQGTA